MVLWPYILRLLWALRALSVYRGRRYVEVSIHKTTCESACSILEAVDLARFCGV